MKRKKPIRRVAPRTVAYNEELAAIKPALIARCGGRCEMPCCGRQGTAPHHRLRRSQGGKNTLANLLWLCDQDHRYIHDHPAESYERGWLLRRTGGKTWTLT